MCKRQIKLKKLISILKSLGFNEHRHGSHGIFKHFKTGLIVTLPMNRKDVPVVYQKAILRRLVDCEMITENDFWRLLE
jgi:predicted RNA binding protein YcfA (HicA-like mRNA interferase family)